MFKRASPSTVMYLNYDAASRYRVCNFYRDTVEIHLWQADDESWRTRSKGEPVCSGAESFISGTASCRIAVSGVDELYTRLQQAKVIHPNAHISNTEWGTREFGVTDPDNNLITFFERLPKE